MISGAYIHICKWLHSLWGATATLIALGTAGIAMWKWWRSKTILECARQLRDYATRMKYFSNNPNASFPKSILMKQLGKRGKLIDRVLEFMEEKKWAVRLPDFHWKIN